jgi:hypothetical protein
MIVVLGFIDYKSYMALVIILMIIAAFFVNDRFVPIVKNESHITSALRPIRLLSRFLHSQERAPITAHGSSGCYIDLKFGGTKVSVALICFKDFGFLPWVPEVPKASDQSPIPPACLLAAIRRVPINYRAGQLTAMEWSPYDLRSVRG